MIHGPCACKTHCGDVPEDAPGQEYAVCKSLPRAPEPPLVEIIMVPRNSARFNDAHKEN